MTIEDGDEDPVVPCPYCGELVHPSQLVTWQSAPRTHWNPAEYEDGCEKCCPRLDRDFDTHEERRGER